LKDIRSTTIEGLQNMNTETSHQEYIKHVADIALARLPAEQRENVKAHITYGAGAPGLRGVTYYGVWQNGEPEPIPFVEICAFGEENDIQLAGTTIHELGHVLAGAGAGHGKAWREACEALGLRKAKAAGNVYCMAQFAPDIRFQIAALTSPTDGKPVGAHSRGGILPINGIKPKACPLGIGTRGGKSRGTGSGSRLRKYVCECAKPVIVRVASDDFRAHCDVCSASFRLA
jgi:hypothetical protein